MARLDDQPEATARGPLRHSVTGAEYDVFLVHASRDKDRVICLHDALRARVRSFLDVDTPVGAYWRRHIPEALQRTAVVLVALSRPEERSYFEALSDAPYAEDEVHKALSLHRAEPEWVIIAPALLDGPARPGEFLPVGLDTFQGVVIQQPDPWRVAADRIEAVVRSLAPQYRLEAALRVAFPTDDALRRWLATFTHARPPRDLAAHGPGWRRRVVVWLSRPISEALYEALPPQLGATLEQLRPWIGVDPPPSPSLAHVLERIELEEPGRSWVLQLIRLSTSPRPWAQISREAIARGHGPLLAFMIAAWLGDAAPSAVRRLAQRPDWTVLRPAEADLWRPPEDTLRALLGDVPTARSTAAPLPLEQVLGLVVWLRHPTPERPPELMAAFHAAFDAVSSLRAELVERCRGEVLLLGGQRWDATACVQWLLPDEGPAEPPPGLRAFLAASAFAPLLDLHPQLVRWLAEGLAEDHLRANVLARLLPAVARPARAALDAWATEALADESPLTLRALLTLDMMWAATAGPPTAGPPTRFATRWAARYGDRLQIWVAELAATRPEDIPGDSKDARRARRRVLERMDVASRDAWIKRHPRSILGPAMAGGGVPRDRLTSWADVLSPDADDTQRRMIYHMAARGSTAARETLERWRQDV